MNNKILQTLNKTNPKKLSKALIIIFAVLLFVSIFASIGFSATAPQQNDKFYEIYDLLINDVVKGPIGYIIAVISGVYAAVMLATSRVVPAIMGIAGTAFIVIAPSIVESLGAIIY